MLIFQAVLMNMWNASKPNRVLIGEENECILHANISFKTYCINSFGKSDAPSSSNSLVVDAITASGCNCFFVFLGYLEDLVTIT